jgi:hypothetical protein
MGPGVRRGRPFLRRVYALRPIPPSRFYVPVGSLYAPKTTGAAMGDVISLAYTAVIFTAIIAFVFFCGKV